MRLVFAGIAALLMTACVTITPPSCHIPDPPPGKPSVCQPSTTVQIECANADCTEWRWWDGCQEQRMKPIDLKVQTERPRSGGATVLVSLLMLSSAADLQSTLAARHRLGRDFREQNPILRPLFASPPAAAAALIAVNYLTIRESLRLRRKHRRGWWAPFVFGIVGHAIAAEHNTHLRGNN